jgi:hypothetical protein
MKELYMTEQELYHDGAPNSAEASSDENSIYGAEEVSYDVEQTEVSPKKKRILVCQRWRELIRAD